MNLGIFFILAGCISAPLAHGDETTLSQTTTAGETTEFSTTEATGLECPADIPSLSLQIFEERSTDYMIKKVGFMNGSKSTGEDEYTQLAFSTGVRGTQWHLYPPYMFSVQICYEKRRSSILLRPRSSTKITKSVNTATSTENVQSEIHLFSNNRSSSARSSEDVTVARFEILNRYDRKLLDTYLSFSGGADPGSGCTTITPCTLKNLIKDKYFLDELTLRLTTVARTGFEFAARAYAISNPANVSQGCYAFKSAHSVPLTVISPALETGDVNLRLDLESSDPAPWNTETENLSVEHDWQLACTGHSGLQLVSSSTKLDSLVKNSILRTAWPSSADGIGAVHFKAQIGLAPTLGPPTQTETGAAPTYLFPSQALVLAALLMLFFCE